MHQLEGAEQSYNMPGVMLLEGQLDRNRFEEAFRSLIGRHETLRTGFEMVNGEPVQRICREVNFSVEMMQASEGEADAAIRSFIRPFDLEKPPLLRVGLIELSQDRHILMYDMHHIISDGVSMEIVVEEFVRLYGGEKLPPLRIQYKDYAAWQQSEPQQELMKQQESYWLQAFGGELPVLEMPADYARPSVQSYEGDTFEFAIDPGLSEALRRIAAESGTTLYMVLLAAYTILLQKYTGQEDIIVGTPNAGRTHGDLQPLIGMFVNTLAIRNYPAGSKTFLEYLEQVKETSLGAFENQDYPFEELVEKLQVARDLSRNPLFDTMFSLHNMDSKDLELAELRLKPYPAEYKVAKFDLSLDVAEGAEGMACSLEYATALYRRESIERMAKHFGQLLEAITQEPEARLSSLGMLTEEEKAQIQHVFNDAEAGRSQQKTVPELFEEQVERTPDRIAVVHEDKQLTYRELNERANRLARTLRAEDVKPEQLVGIMADRSLDMIVGIMAILKSGGAYVPIDPKYPEDRIHYMLDDSNAQVLLAQRHLQARAAFSGRRITLDEEAFYDEDGSNLERVNQPEHLSYVIYTSGTTGKPKGVMIEHRQMAVLSAAWESEYGLREESMRWMQWASFSFDVFSGDLIRALLHGGELILCPEESRANPAEIYELIRKHRIQMFDVTPSLAIPLMEYVYENKLDISSMKLAVVGADHCPKEEFQKLLERFGSQMRIVNSYGVTETTIDSCYFEQASTEGLRTVPIGKPLPGVTMYILDDHHSLLPVGITGELYIGGPCVGRGYWKRPDLTAEKFVDNPFAPGERMYRTGDLARWLPDGNVEYLGRIDHQVKIRGYRIEIGEVESQLLKTPFIREAVVVAREDAGGQKSLCAYFVAERELTVSELRGALAAELPGYMIPSYFVQLKQLPLTPNGKIDRKALPAPEGSAHTGTDYVAPRTEAEKTLAAVWQAVLGAERVGLMDHFFELGGDSIKSIQVSSRLHQAGYKLEIRDLFKYPTIAELSPHIQPVGRMADQGEVSGTVPLTPIQRWYFGQQFADPHHYNQSVMLHRKEGFDTAAIRKALQKLVEHHDGLRMVFRKTEEGYTAWNRGIGEGELYRLYVADFTGVAACERMIEAAANEIQSGIDLQAGPLVRAGLFHGADGDHLLIVIHHAVVDGVSWRILLEDFAASYEQALKGQALRLPFKTDSYRTWSDQLVEYARSPVMQRERAYWQRIAQTAAKPLPRDYEAECSLQQDSESVTVQWSQEATEQLLKHVHRAYNTEMNDILLTALGMAVQKWCGRDRVLVTLEGHGRESIMTDIDITRTVGWFTSEYPVLLEMEPDKSLSSRIKKMKEDLRQIPNKGIGYGIGRYMSELHDEAVWGGAEPDISFNYLGQFDQDMKNNEMEVSPYSSGMEVSRQQARTHALDINGMVADGSLALELSYSRKEYRKETIEALSIYLQESLQEIILHCTAKERPEVTPSDILLQGLSVEELEQIAKQTQRIGDIENMYTLTPMQKGMWFHSAMDQHAGAYFEQTRFTLQGALDVEVFAKSLDALAKQHAVLRTNFYNGWNGELLQIVFRDKRLGFAYEDLCALPEAERETHVETLTQEDRMRGFDLEQDALMRVSVVRMAEESYQVLWSSHHILMDGWCLPQLTQEWFDTYSAYVQHQHLERTTAPAYSQYIEWLEQQDDQAASAYWANYLAGYDQQTVLPQAKGQGRSDEYAAERILCELGKALTGRMSHVAKQHQVTLNTLMQAAWAILLQKYNGTDDVVFGGVVSGRPAEIPGIEAMIGLFINTIPVRVTCEAETSFAELMGRLQEQALESGRYDYYPLYEIQAQCEQKQDLISHLMVFENYPMEEQMEQAGSDDRGKLTITDVEVAEQTNYDFNLVVVPGDEIVIRLEYNANVFDRESIEQLQGHLVHVLEQITANPHMAVGELELATAGEKTQLMLAFNDTAAEYPREKTIHQMFEEQAERTPDAAAVLFEQEQLTYRELNERANRLARTLRALGVQPDQLVGIMAERSLEMMVGIMAILKAGGAYVPIAADSPEERIRYLLEDSGAQVLLLQGRAGEEVSFAGRIVNLDDANSYAGDGSNPERVNQASDAAYVIYTSGTTGRPKGVLVEHGSVINRLLWMQKRYPIGPSDTIMQKTAITFDVSVWELFWWAFVGSKVCLLPVGGEKNPAVILDTIERQHISTMHFVPSMLHAFLEYVEEQPVAERERSLASLRRVFASGEALTASQAERFERCIAPVNGARLINLYGPTEATVDVTYFDCQAGQPYTSVPIGRPIDNTQIYIVNRQNQLQPIGVAGELCIAGAGLARGYWERPELTAEKFVEIPFKPSERMYRTGDLARWLPDGNIEYLGRLDHQVKIRGYRIELGEIEAQLLQAAAIRETVVVAREDESGQKALCAYFAADSELTVSELRSALAAQLPDYMIPSYFVQLERLPLSANGKIDRKALPSPEGSLYTGTEYVAPRTEAEKTIAVVWQAVLGIERVGVTDHFFELGGDSIKSIQVASRLQQAGYKLEIRELFKYPTIAQLSLQVRPVARMADQGEVAGEMPLTPILSWFMEQEFANPHHFNQSIMLHRQEGFDEVAIRKTLHNIVEHHDALRMVFRKTEHGGYKAWNRGISEGDLYSLDVADFKEDPECGRSIEAKANEIQSGIDLQTGPLVKAGLFHCADGDHLLIVIHHTVIDGISWRILLEDIADGYEQALKGQEIRLPVKTDSYRIWSEQLATYAHSSDLENERAYWQRIAQTDTEPLPKDWEAACSLQRESESVNVQWSREDTERLLKHVHRAYNTEMNDILLAALGMAVHKWCGRDRVLVTLEGHGRESILTDIDITRTVGWFTSEYPVLIEAEPDKTLSYRIKQVKENLRRIPNKGIGYGICRYLSSAQEPAWTEAFTPELRFNYLGQFDQDLQGNELELSSYSSGSDMSDEQVRNYSLDISGMIVDGLLSLDVSYSGKEYRKETIEELAGCLLVSLQEIIDHCAAKERPELTPSDVLLQGLSVEELDQIAEQTRRNGEIENIYTLTPMQKGMWFHSAMDRQSGAYHEQTRFTIEGELDTDVFVKSLDALANNHAVLRTNFLSGWNGEPLQVVFRDKRIGFAYADLRELQEADRNRCIEKSAAEDHARGFDLEQDALMRVMVMRTGESSYQVIWSSHHILMDGWCLPQLAKELFDTYSVYLQQHHPEQATSVPAYSQYIEWLEQQDEAAASAYWSEYLAGYDQQAALPQQTAQGRGEEYVAEKLTCELGKTLSGRMSRVARQHQVTLNTLLQAAWGIILQKYNGTRDTVFGSVVSGRPAEIPGIEAMIGLFINTIPVRVSCEAKTSFAEVMGRLQEQALESGKYDYYPLYEIQARCSQKQDLISQIMVFENYPMDEQMEQAGNDDQGMLAITNVEVAEQTNYDFNFIVVPGEEIVINFDYNARVFDRTSMERLQGHLVNVLEQIAANPQVTVGELKLATEAEQAEITSIFNNARTEYPRDKTIHRLFEEQAERTPDAIAVMYENSQLTYRELNERANRLARTLRADGAGADRLVGLMVERSLDMMVGIIAILKSGGAYVPIDPEYPEERIRYMLEDSGTQIIVTQRHLQERIPGAGTRVILDDEHSYSSDSTNLDLNNGPADLAYVIYTSGTTGKPKGNLTMHRNIVRVVQGADYIDIGEQDNVLQLSSYAFDGSTFDMYGALLNGARLVLIPQETLLDVERLAELIERERISVMFITTAFFNVLVDVKADCLRHIRAILFGGERVSVSHVRKALRHLGPGKIKHVYGPTESTVFATCHDVNEVAADALNVPIGRPISNTTIYIVNEENGLQPIGVAGELCVAGDGLARGYLNRPELTAEKFVDNPFVPGERMYRTGDLARWLPDGSIEYVGRIDHQVKIRGYRIELGEVEAHLLKVQPVQEGTVVARETGSGEKQLCAYFVAESTLSASELRGAMAQQLPGYMIPSYFVQLERMPLTPNGKVDQKALPAPEEHVQTGTEYIAPRTPQEEQLARIWQEVLGLEKVGVNDNFFELGGHSLRATTMASKLHKELSIELPLRDVFKHPTLEAMAERIAGLGQQMYTSIPLVEEQAHYPLSSAQKRLYILHQLEGAELSYNMPNMLLLEGALDRERFEAAFRKLIARHESFRTGFEMINGEPMQRIYENVDFAVEYMQASDKEAEARLRQFVRAFKLEEPPLLRVGLIELAQERHILMFDMHHIVSDGTSMGILINEFVRLYGGEELQPLRIQYKDFAAWQQSDARQEQMKQQEAYWLQALGGELPVLEMPTDHVRPAVQSFRGDILQFVIGRDQCAALRHIGSENGATLYMVLLAAYTALLHKYTGQEDIIVGTPIAGRNHGDVQPLIGMFVNTLAIRNYPMGEKTFHSYLEEVKDTTLGAYENQNYPFEDLVENVQVARDMSRNPIFDTMFILQNAEQGEMNINGLHIANYQSEHTVSKFDLTFQAEEAEEEIVCSIEYATELYELETVERMAGHFTQLIDAVVGNPHARLASLQMVTAEEQDQIQNIFNATDMGYPREKTIHQMFEEQAERTPDAPAVSFGDEMLTYRELNRKANQLAWVLRDRGVASERPVGIMVERSIAMVVGVLAVLKAGGTFVPIDPEYPETRIRYMLEDSGAKLALTELAWFEVIPPEVEKVDIHDASLYQGHDENVPNESEPSNLLYIIYTSGTTGNPKGVMLEQRNLINLLHYEQVGTSIPLPSRILQYASNSFDVCYQEMFSALLFGGCLFLIPNEARKDPAQLFTWIQDNGIEVLYLPVAFLKFIFAEPEWAERFPDCVTHIITAGEQLVVTPQIQACLQRLRISLHNHYGPSETHVVTAYTMEPDDIAVGLPPIGAPIANTAIYILNDRLELQPIGIAGELYVSGDCVGRGYWGRQELTDEKFIANPFAPGDLMYKTGDVARWLPDGTIEYVGRSDHQVKIRGFRIELGEVESQLLSVEFVQEATVMAREDDGGQKQLCAYFVAERPLSAAELRGGLSQDLPGYMIPSYFVQLDRLPLTPNGKIDRRALPEPEGSLHTGAEFVAPRTPLEAQLARIWQDVLGLPDVSVKDNFFDLGGHSLRATTLASKVFKEMHVNLPLRDVFRCPTIEEMAGMIAGMEKQEYAAIPLAEESDVYPLSSAQKRLYIVSQLEGADLSYNMPGVVSLEGTLDRERFELAFLKLISRHETLRTGFDMVDGEPIQRVHRSVKFVVEHRKAATVQDAEQLIRRFIRTFDLRKPPLLRVGLVELERERHILMFDMHHIISDGASLGNLVSEFAQLYAGEERAPLRIQYKDYAVWQQSGVHSEHMKRQEAYWLEKLAGELPVVELPTDYDRPAVRSFEGAQIEFEVDAALTQRLSQLASNRESTLYMVLLSAYTVLLSKYSGQEDIIVGTPVAGRAHADLEPLIGMFVNTLAIRNHPAGDKTFLSLLEEVKETALGAFEHQDYPFEELVERLNVQWDANRNPVFDTMFVMQNTEDHEVRLEALTLSPYVLDNPIDAKFDLTLFVSEDNDVIKGGFQYGTKLFKAAMIHKIMRDFLLVLAQIVEDPHIRLRDIKCNEQSVNNQRSIETIEFAF
nr:non-ribosomal peptide synthetase [Paenibacillus sp. OSY-SE]